ncbi:glutathione S-transferase [Andreprevotia lacus DSM 23236]|uniref:Glutathione S-transferase n=1 Tax=Andreprevotia lacus DSM 23236 TaxID=1121001 RepID=A0A1W1X6Y6_9NEIS|nr:glutathione S-transferase family protein [Andreprevotia lacus]SMC19574.1 glutathione S-transferase [Andreprevotia lacus DSM 23236]
MSQPSPVVALTLESTQAVDAPMRLYHHPMSASARRAVMTVLHLGAPVELVEVGNISLPDERAKLLQRNPNGKIPVFEHGDFVLWESYAIMQYLCDLTPGQTLYPATLQARVDVNRWLFWCAQHWSIALGALAWENCMKGMLGMGERDAVVVQRAEVDAVRLGKVLDDHLATRTWLVGEQVTLAEYALAAALGYQEQGRMPLQQFAHLQAWFQRVQALPAWQQTTF